MTFEKLTCKRVIILPQHWKAGIGVNSALTSYCFQGRHLQMLHFADTGSYNSHNHIYVHFFSDLILLLKRPAGVNMGRMSK